MLAFKGYTIYRVSIIGATIHLFLHMFKEWEKLFRTRCSFPLFNLPPQFYENRLTFSLKLLSASMITFKRMLLCTNLSDWFTYLLTAKGPFNILLSFGFGPLCEDYSLIFLTEILPSDCSGSLLGVGSTTGHLYLARY